jgi:hypothetical protein
MTEKLKESPFDDAFEKFDLEEEKEETTLFPKKDEIDLTDDFDFNADFDDFHTEPGIDEEAEEGKISLFEEEEPQEEAEDEDEFDFSGTIFDEPEVKEEETPLQVDTNKEQKVGGLTATGEKEESNEKELSSYRSMVDEILSDKGDEPELRVREVEEETPADFPEPSDIEEDEKASAEPPVAAKPVSPPTASRTDGTTRFAKPPILSPTLGEIYISQGRFEEALDVFKQLLSKYPENQRIQKKIKDIQSMVDRQKSS